MSTVEGGIIRALSVSQAEQFDSEQTGGCPRRWYLERVDLRRPEKTNAHGDGDAGHELFANYFDTGEPPKGRVRMGKAVRAALQKPWIPAPSPGMLVEQRFDGQPKRDSGGRWLPLDTTKTLWLGGVPWDGFVDLRFQRPGGGTLRSPGPKRVEIWDHKFSSDIHQYAKAGESLIRTVQMPVYALDSLRIWPDTKTFRFVHHYVSRRGKESFIREQVVAVDRVLERRTEVERLVEQMKTAARAPSAEDVPFNRRACTAYMGCPHQSICSAFKEKKMNLSKEDLELFGMLDVVGSGSKTEETFLRETNRIGSALGVQPMTHAELREAHDQSQELDGDFPLPAASTPVAQPPICSGCGTELHRENGSERDGVWTHIRCPAQALEVKPARFNVVHAADGKQPWSDGPSAVCADCPHPAHVGVTCGAKRGRGLCRCGQAATVKPERPAPPAPVFAGEDEPSEVGESDAAIREKYPAAYQPDDASHVAASEDRPPLARSAASLPFAEAARDDAAAPLTRASLIPANITVTVQVELGPTTLAFLQALVKR